jgi:hypothetical protein
MSSTKILITRPEHDTIMKYLSEWSDELIILAEEKGFDIKDMGCDNATRQNFEKYLDKIKPRLVLINGHGSPDSVAGHNNEVLVGKGDNESILKDKITYSLSCDSALELGPSAVEHGATAFIGYNKPFCFLTDTDKECVPEEDDLANIFRKPAIQISISLIKGKSIGRAYSDSQNMSRELIKKYGASDSLLGAEHIRFWLFWNMTAQIALGKEDATIND